MYELADQSISSKSENQFLEDINQALVQSPNDKHVAALANILKASYYLQLEEIQKANQFMIKAKPMVDQIKSDQLKHEYQFVQVFLLRFSNEIDKASDTGQQLYETIKSDWPKHKISHLLLELAYLKNLQFKYVETLELLKLALDVAYESRDPFQVAESYNVFGIVYSELNDSVTANEFFLKSVKLLEKHPTMFKDSFLYINLADSYRDLKDYEKAQEYLQKAEERAEKNDDKIALSYAYQIKSRVFADEKNYEAALAYLLNSKELITDYGIESYDYDIDSELAYVYLKKGEIAKAEEYLNLIVAASEKSGEVNNFFHDSIRAEILSKKGLYQEAYEALDSSFTSYKEKFNAELTQMSSISRQQLDKAKLNFDNKFLARESELNAKLAEEAKRYNGILWILVALLIVSIAILLWFLYRFRGVAIKNKRLALTDNLTKMPNRRHVFNMLNKYHEKAKGDSFTYSIIIFDIDHFKAINDRYGHNIGDQVIQSVKFISKSVLRNSDIVGRIGGEEFLIVLPNTGVENATKIAERIRELFEAHVFENLADDLKVTASFGVTQVCGEDEKVDFVVNRADRQMYKAKHEGRNKVVAFLG